MKALASEMFYPDDQYIVEETGEKDKNDKPVTNKALKDNAKGYMIKPLKSLQLTEIYSLGDFERGRFRFTFPVIVQLLKYGLDADKPISLIDEMPSAHHARVAREIFFKSQVADEERKNS